MPSEGNRRCHHCGREVGETVHTRTAYRVDYYALHTGPAEAVTVAQTEEGLPPLTVWRLLEATEILSCADCYREPRVRAQREHLFRPERSDPAAAGAAVVPQTGSR